MLMIGIPFVEFVKVDLSVAVVIHFAVRFRMLLICHLQIHRLEECPDFVHVQQSVAVLVYAIEQLLGLTICTFLLSSHVPTDRLHPHFVVNTAPQDR